MAVLAIGAVVAVGPFIASGSASADTNADGSFTASKQITRINLEDSGTTTVVDSRTFSVSVSQTQGLRNLQDVDVRWSGAHPTGSVQNDYNSGTSDQQEYPVVILECRGTDPSDPGYVAGSPTAIPETCWTHGEDDRYQSIGYTDFAPWRLDAFADAANRAAVANRPASVPDACGSPALNEYWVPFIAAGGTSYGYGNSDCAGIPPEDYEIDTSESVVPPNATFAATSVTGTGSIKFDVQTDEENASLGCSSTVACTLEVIPIMGLSCDPFGVSTLAPGLPAADIPTAGSDETKAAGLCEAGASSYYPPGSLHSNEPQNLAVSGALWWSASNWHNRVSVPLNFAPESNACALVGSSPVFVYGSELMEQATQQWAPTFCADPKLFNLTHVATAEPLAKTLVDSGSADAAFSSEPPPGGFSAPVVEAPVAVTGFSVSYTVDDAQGNQITTLKLDARLLAKLLTESYREIDFSVYAPGQFPYLAGNPLNITQDPEFQALNPGIARPTTQAAEDGLTAGASMMIALDGNSDVTYALTSYIESDPEARAWLAGKPDPWGMVVNRNYNTSLSKNLVLPTYEWPLLDQTVPNFGLQSPCETHNPSPWLPSVASPEPTLALTTTAVQFASPPSKILCTTTDPGNAQDLGAYEFTGAGRQQPSARFVIGVTSVGEAQRYDLESAQLQTANTSTDYTKRFTSGSGRTFVGPTDASIDAAAKMMVPDPVTQTWTMPYSTLHSNPKAYPGTMIVNADVPTTGLPAALAGDYANLLRYAAGPGQQPGLSTGQLPPGYLPMTAANGLGAQVAYTLRAASDVAEQTGTVAPIIAVAGSSAGASAPAPVATGSRAVSSPAVPVSPSASATPITATTSGLTDTGPISLAATKSTTPRVGAGPLGLILPAVLGLGVFGLLASGASYVSPRRLGRRR